MSLNNHSREALNRKYSLTDNASKTIPQISNLKNIVFSNQISLNLSGNCFTQEIPSLTSLKNLKVLNLSSNHLQKLWKFPESLESLILSCNHILTINSLFHMKKLKFLDLSCNIIKSIEKIDQLINLSSLYLGKNLIENIEPIKTLKNLGEIDLEHNLLKNSTNFLPLLDSNVSVFIVKNNPGTLEFKKLLENQYPNVIESREVYCKNIENAKNSIIWKNLERQGGLNTERQDKIYKEYNKAIKNTDIIHEVDEFHDELLTEVENLKNIANESLIKCTKLQKIKRPNAYQSPKIENLLMRFEEIMQENKNDLTSHKKSVEIEENYLSKVNDLKRKGKILRENYKNLKLESIEAANTLENIELEKNGLNEAISFLQISNESLRSEIIERTQQLKKRTIKKSHSVSKKSLNGTNGLYKPIPLIKIMSKDSLSPVYNSSFHALTEITKRNPSIDLLRSNTTKAKGKVPVRPYRISN